MVGQLLALARRKPFSEEQFSRMLEGYGHLLFMASHAGVLELGFGPKCEEHRRKELRSRLMWVYTNRSPREVSLFMAMAEAIIEELELYGITRFDGDGHVLDQLWSFLRDRHWASDSEFVLECLYHNERNGFLQLWNFLSMMHDI